MTAISIIAEVNTLFWQMLLVFFLISALMASTNLRKVNAVPIVQYEDSGQTSQQTAITASDLKSTPSCTSSVISILREPPLSLVAHAQNESVSSTQAQSWEAVHAEEALLTNVETEAQQPLFYVAYIETEEHAEEDDNGAALRSALLPLTQPPKVSSSMCNHIVQHV